jgi:hypothetical protein
MLTIRLNSKTLPEEVGSKVIQGPLKDRIYGFDHDFFIIVPSSITKQIISHPMDMVKSTRDTLVEVIARGLIGAGKISDTFKFENEDLQKLFLLYLLPPRTAIHPLELVLWRKGDRLKAISEKMGMEDVMRSTGKKDDTPPGRLPSDLSKGGIPTYTRIYVAAFLRMGDIQFYFNLSDEESSMADRLAGTGSPSKYDEMVMLMQKESKTYSTPIDV